MDWAFWFKAWVFLFFAVSVVANIAKSGGYQSRMAPWEHAIAAVIAALTAVGVWLWL